MKYFGHTHLHITTNEFLSAHLFAAIQKAVGLISARYKSLMAPECLNVVEYRNSCTVLVPLFLNENFRHWSFGLVDDCDSPKTQGYIMKRHDLNSLSHDVTNELQAIRDAYAVHDISNVGFIRSPNNPTDDLAKIGQVACLEPHAVDWKA